MKIRKQSNGAIVLLSGIMQHLGVVLELEKLKDWICSPQGFLIWVSLMVAASNIFTDS